MPRYQLTKIAEFPALGGYPESEINAQMKKERYTPTTVGIFTIYAIEAHRSGGRWQMSVVPWGAETKITGTNVVSVKINGVWEKLSGLPHWKKLTTEQAVLDALLDSYDVLFNQGTVEAMARVLGIDRIEIIGRMGAGVLVGSPAGREIPDKWLLNDFGHKSIKYFKDRNHDGRYNRGDRFINDFMHSSPLTEVWTDLGVTTQSRIRTFALSRATDKTNFNQRFDNALLGHSHGCIHLFPHDIDTMVANGYLEIGGIIKVHPYDESSKSILTVNRQRTLDFEVHFFPKDCNVFVFKTQRLPRPSSLSPMVTP